MRTIGYGICGKGEAGRKMEDTLKCFARLCDETVILGNNIGEKERKLISKYGFQLVEDNREWGTNQHKIKEDFVSNYVAALKPDWCVGLDMDEVLEDDFTRETIEEADKYTTAIYVYVLNLWGEGWKRQWSFWNVRAWKWTGQTKFLNRPLHCGLAPEWAYHYGNYLPYVLFHSGLQDKKTRAQKVKRYEKYDPDAKYRSREYYDGLKDDSFDPLDLQEIKAAIIREAGDYRHKKTTANPKDKGYTYVRTPQGDIVDVPNEDVAETLKRPGFFLANEPIPQVADRRTTPPPNGKSFAYVRNKHGVVNDIPASQVEETIKREGMVFLGWEDEVKKEMEDLFADEELHED